MKKLVLQVILILAVIFMAGCSGGDEDSTTTSAAGDVSGDNLVISLENGAESLMGYEPEALDLEVIRQGETMNLSFIGVSLNAVLANLNAADFSKIELVISDMEENMDITEWAKADAGVFLAWSESGVDETPFRVFPKDAGTANLLIRNVTAVLIEK